MTASKRPIRVLLADDHVLVRGGLKRLIKEKEPLTTRHPLTRLS